MQHVRAAGPTGSDRAVGGAFRRAFPWRTLLTTLVFDICGPLLIYRGFHAAGASGVPPALGVAIAAKRHRRLDVIGALVLLGVVIGTSLGLLTHDPRLVLLEGAVPTLLFSPACCQCWRGVHSCSCCSARSPAPRGITAAELREFRRRWSEG